jgi:hypothetical protein
MSCHRVHIFNRQINESTKSLGIKTGYTPLSFSYDRMVKNEVVSHNLTSNGMLFKEYFMEAIVCGEILHGFT